MKLLNILGAVIAVHIAVLVLAIIIPGCRSTGSASGDETRAPGAVFPAPASSPISAAPEMSDADLNPPLATSVPSSFDPNAPAIGRSSTGAFRATPTRPSTPVAESMAPTSISQPAVTPAETYTVQRGDNLWSLAKKNGLTVRELASVNGLPADAGLRVGQVLIIPGHVVTPPPTAAVGFESTDAPATTTYTIRPGDTLGKIARQYGTTVREIKAFNRMTSDLVRAGDTLSIPVAADTPAATAPTESQPTASPPPATSASAYRHTVAAGESLTVIANRYGVRIGDIALANKIRDPSLIRPGQELVIPGWEAPAPSEPADEPIVTISASAPSTISAAEEDLDAGLDDEDLSDVPVITVEDEVPTLGGDDDSSPPVFE